MAGVAASDTVRLVVALVPDTPITTSTVPLAVALLNDGPAPVRVLRHFLPLPVFFELDLVRDDGTPVATIGAGKIAFSEGEPDYADLRPGELVGVAFDLVDVLPPGESLAAGSYLLTATYHNQYGEDCFQGVLRSRQLPLTL
jgi:hypothetical protein